MAATNRSKKMAAEKVKRELDSCTAEDGGSDVTYEQDFDMVSMPFAFMDSFKVKVANTRRQLLEEGCVNLSEELTAYGQAAWICKFMRPVAND